jgi:hypothetical protein
MESKEKKTLIISGDIAVDWNLIPYDNTRGFSRMCAQPGGVLLLTELIKRISEKANETNKSCEWNIKHVEMPSCEFQPDNTSVPNYFISWAKYPAKKGAKEKTIWRAKEFLTVEKNESGVSSDILYPVEDADADRVCAPGYPYRARCTIGGVG